MLVLILRNNDLCHRTGKNPVLKRCGQVVEVFNVIQAERCGTDIITLAPNLIAGRKILEDLDEYSLDTVKCFLRIPLKLVLKYKVNTKILLNFKHLIKKL